MTTSSVKGFKGLVGLFSGAQQHLDPIALPFHAPEVVLLLTLYVVLHSTPLAKDVCTAKTYLNSALSAGSSPNQQ
jgi:hypothetical protein